MFQASYDADKIYCKSFEKCLYILKTQNSTKKNRNRNKNKNDHDEFEFDRSKRRAILNYYFWGFYPPAWASAGYLRAAALSSSF